MQSKQAVEQSDCCCADGTAFTTPAVGPGLGMHGGSIQSNDEGQMPTGAFPGAQGEAQIMKTPDLWLPDLTPPTNMARPQDSQDMALAQEDQTTAVAQAAPTTAVATNGIAICLLLCFISFQQGRLLMTCKLRRGFMSLCNMHAH